MTVGRRYINRDCRSMDETTKRKPTLKIREALKEVVHQAFRQDRLVQGVLDAIDVLERNPRDVMFIALEQAKMGNKDLEIQEKLIHAFCMENSINVIKVNKCDTLLQHIHHGYTVQSGETNSNILKPCSSNEGKPTTISEDNQPDTVQCILVRKPEVLSTEDSFLTNVCDTLVSSQITSCPFIRI